MASVTKKTWTGPNGEAKSAWAVRYMEAGKRRSKSFERKKDADAYKRKVEAEIEAGTHVGIDDALRVREVVTRFLDHYERRWESGQIGFSRLRFMRQVCRKHIVPQLGNLKFTELNWDDLEKFTASMNSCSHRTKDHHTAVLKLIEDFAMKRGFTKKVMVREFRSEVGGSRSAPIRTFTMENVAALMRDLEVRAPSKTARGHAMLRCMVHLAAFCTLRYGEIMGLTLKEVDLHRRVVKVRHSLTAYDEHKGPKTAAGRRDVPMPDHIAVMLQDWIQNFQIENDRGLLFLGRTGETLSASNFHMNFWRPLLERVGLGEGQRGEGRYHFHALRHFASSWMIENGLALPDVASLMGHSKFDTTLQVYAHPIVGGHRRHEAFSRMATTLLTNTAGALPES